MAGDSAEDPPAIWPFALSQCQLYTGSPFRAVPQRYWFVPASSIAVLMKSGWKVIFPLFAIGFPIVIVGGIVVFQKIAADREYRATIDLARSKGVLASPEDLAALAPPAAENVLTPLNDVWKRNPGLLRQLNSTAFTSAPRSQIDEVIEAAREAVKRKEAFEIPELDQEMFGSEWHTMYVLGEAAALAASRGDTKRSTEFLDLLDALDRKLVKSKNASLVKSGYSDHQGLSQLTLLCSYLARVPVGNLYRYSKAPDREVSDFDLAKVECARVLTLLDQAVEKSGRALPGSSLTPEQVAALRNGRAVREVKMLIIGYYAALQDPKKMAARKEGFGLEEMIPPVERDPDLVELLRMADGVEELSAVPLKRRWVKAVPPDLLPWFSKACRSNPKPPAGIDAARDQFGRPILFKASAGGMAIYTLGKNGKEEGRTPKSDDRWIRVDTPKAGGRLLQPRVTFSD